MMIKYFKIRRKKYKIFGYKDDNSPALTVDGQG